MVVVVVMSVVVVLSGFAAVMRRKRVGRLRWTSRGGNEGSGCWGIGKVKSDGPVWIEPVPDGCSLDLMG